MNEWFNLGAFRVFETSKKKTTDKDPRAAEVTPKSNVFSLEQNIPACLLATFEDVQYNFLQGSFSASIEIE